MLDLHCCAGFSLVVMKVSHSVVPRLYSPWNSPDQNTGEGSLSLLQGIFSTQGLNPGLPHCRWILYQLSHKGSPRTLEWVAFPFSRGSSQPRDRTQVSCTAGRFLPAELQRKPNNTGIGSPSLLQQIFPTRESNRDLPHCGQILYHLSYEGSVLSIEPYINN